MKYVISSLLTLFLILLFTSCDSGSNDPISPEVNGSIYVSTNPSGANIWLDGVNTFKTTPDSITNVDAGLRYVTLKLEDYRDTTLSISVSNNQKSVVGPVLMTSNISSTLHGPIRIYETTGTTSSMPSGLDLSAGVAYGVSSIDANLVDLYYSTTGNGGQGYLVQSADLFPSLVRQTDFNVGSSTNIFDNADSPLRNIGSWKNNMADREANYVFLYDHDGHYSKIKIVNYGGGVPGEPAWVEVQWYFNLTLLDNRF